ITYVDIKGCNDNSLNLRHFPVDLWCQLLLLKAFKVTGVQQIMFGLSDQAERLIRFNCHISPFDLKLKLRCDETL
ncbi:hypothetical protein, partial [Pedobacter sp. AK017]|uniref:hypothetical protein n=1 Tax=Pedobacter sp. AK017 TaxID=2723073 RepID=UPI001C84F311